MRARRAFIVLLAAGAAALFAAAPAGAHALLKSSVPANGSTVAQAPRTIRLVFTEPPEPPLSSVGILDSSGHTVSGVGRPQAAPGDPDALVVAVRPGSLSNGVYTVTWRTVSKTDGHLTAGSISFGVGVPATATKSGGGTGPSTPAPSPLSVAARWFFYWGLALLLGGAVACVLLFRWTVPRGGRTLFAAACVAAGVGVVLMTAAERASIGLPLGTLLSSSTGRQLVARAIVVAICAAATIWVLARPGRSSLIVLVAAAAAAMFVHAQAGHADTQSSVRALNLFDQWAHLLGVGVWIGGLPWLLLGLRDVDPAARTARASRFAVVATYGVAVVLITGVLRAVVEVGSIQGLFHTSFGWTLLIKSGLVLVLVALGARNHFRLVPRMRGEAAGDATSLRRSVTGEVVVASLVLAVTGVLSGLAPSTYVIATAKPAPPQRIVVRGSDFATTVRVTLTVSPGTVGTNTFVARVSDYDTGKPADADSVELQFSFPGNPNVGSSLDLKSAATGTWTGSGTHLSIDGVWNVDVLIQEPAASTDVQLRLRTRLPPEHITSVVTPGQPTIYTITLGGNITLQTYVDPGSAGPNTVHYTFFNGANEQPISEATARAESPSGAQIDTKLIRFDPGHFGANVTLSSGRWTFFIDATTTSGQHLSAYFPQTIGQ